MLKNSENERLASLRVDKGMEQVHCSNTGGENIKL
jgi:hypothetical protein